jgi:hypothetical protein
MSRRSWVTSSLATGDAGQPGEDGVPELAGQRFEDIGRDGGKSLLKDGVPGAGHAAQCPLGLHGPDGARVVLGAVLEVAQ